MKKKQKKGPAGSPAWMTTWADLVSLLMCFFVLLFSLSSIDEARFQEFAQAMAGRRIFFQGALGTLFSDNAGMMPLHSPPSPPRQAERPPETDALEDYDAAGAGAVLDAILERQGQMAELVETFRTYMAPYDEEVMAEIGITVSELGEYVRFTFPSGMLFNPGRAELLPEAIDMIDTVAELLALYPDNRIAVHGHTDNVPIRTVAFPSNWELSSSRAISVVRRFIDVHGFDPERLDAIGRSEYQPVDTNYTVEGRANNRRVEILVYAQQQRLQVIDE